MLIHPAASIKILWQVYHFLLAITTFCCSAGWTTSGNSARAVAAFAGSVRVIFYHPEKLEAELAVEAVIQAAEVR